MSEELNTSGVTMQKYQYSGKTLDDALAQAANDLGTEKENLSYNIIPSDGGSLLKKFLFKTIKVEAWIEKTEDLHEAARKAVREAIEGGRSQANSSSRDQRHSASSDSERGGQGRQRETSRTAQNAKSAKRQPDGSRAAALQHDKQHDKQHEKIENGKKTSPDHAHSGAKLDAKSSARSHSKPPVKSNSRSQSDAREPTPQQASAPRERRPRLAPEDNPNAITFDTLGVRELLEQYTGLFVKVFEADASMVTYSRTDGGDMNVAVDSPLLEDLLARSDRLSGSFEHVFKRIAQKKLGDLPERLYLNSGDAAEKRNDNLRDMARSMAEKVKSTGRPITVNSKSGQERRIIHVTIDEIEGVATRSVGSGEGRKLVIYSTDKRHRPKKRGGARRKSASLESANAQGSVSISQNETEDSVFESAEEAQEAGLRGAQNPSLNGNKADPNTSSRPKRSRQRRPRSKAPRSPEADSTHQKAKPTAADSQDFNE